MLTPRKIYLYIYLLYIKVICITCFVEYLLINIYVTIHIALGDHDVDNKQHVTI